MGNKIAVIGIVGVPAKYGGFETLTEYLTKHLTEIYDITVFCSSKNYKNKLDSYNGAKLEYLNLSANGVESILYDLVSMFKARKTADTILILGVSGCIALPLLKLFSKAKIVVNIDGLEWKREKWNRFAKSFLKLSEKIAVYYSDEVVTDNAVIQSYVKSEYCKKSSLIAYGADHVKKLPLTEEVIAEFPVLSGQYAMTVCRIEPENNIHVLLEAFAERDALPLVIIGNWINSHYGRSLKQRYNDIRHIHLLAPIYEQSKLNQIRTNCTVYLHGHSAGGTNPSLVEAMYLALPIFAYDVDYNRATTDNKAFYFKDTKELVSLLNNQSGKKDILSACAKTMEDVARKRYLWDQIAQQYSALF